MIHWYGVRVPVQRERWARDVYERHGFAAYLPTEEISRVISRKPKRYKTVTKALYPAHIFVGLPHELSDDLQRWAFLASLPPYRGVLGMGGKPARIKYEEIRAWAEAAGQSGQLTRAIARLKKGQHVQFSEGAMESLPGTVIDVLENGYLIEFNFLGAVRKAMVQDVSVRAA